MTVAASAPGKLILIGEYAVLFGAPAAVMAVNRRASVRIEPSQDDRCRVESPGMGWEAELFGLGSDGAWHSRGPQCLQ